MVKFDPVNSITGNWYSYAAYSTYYGYDPSWYYAEMSISSSGRVNIYMEYGNGYFTSGSFTYYFDYEYTSSDHAYYYLYNNAGELTGVYNITSKTFQIRLNNGSYMMFER